MVLAYIPHFFDKAAIRINSTDIKNSIGLINEAWSSVYANRPFDFRFADESIHRLYQSEAKFGQLFSYFSTLAILIGVLGLVGVVGLDMNLRTKEVGIRKVLGASLGTLIELLSRDFLKLLLIAFAISIPFSYWLSQKWLDNFAYRLTSIELHIALPALGVLLLALAAVWLQTIKSALANPVDSLRNE
jgi:putative ABC transport system permease protein